jgi:hypothetical protein
VEKTEKWAPEKTVVRGSGFILALDESGAGESHIGRMLHILVRPAADSAAALD